MMYLSNSQRNFSFLFIGVRNLDFPEKGFQQTVWWKLEKEKLKFLTPTHNIHQQQQQHNHLFLKESLGWSREFYMSYWIEGTNLTWRWEAVLFASLRLSLWLQIKVMCYQYQKQMLLWTECKLTSVIAPPITRGDCEEHIFKHMLSAMLLEWEYASRSGRGSVFWAALCGHFL